MRPERSRHRPPLLVASHLAPNVLPLYRLIAERIGERLGRATQFVVADSYERCVAPPSLRKPVADGIGRLA